MEEISVHIIVATQNNNITLSISSICTCEQVCITLSSLLHLTPLTTSLFSLCNSASIFLPPNSPLTHLATYYFRIRYKPSCLQRLKDLDPGAYDYYFHQVRNDVLDNNIPEIIYTKYRDELLGLGIADMYRVMLEERKSLDEVVKDYKKYISKEVMKKHSIFAKKPIQQTLLKIKNGGHGAGFVKDQYLKQIDSMAPNYLSEKYKVRKEVDGVLYEVALHVMPFHREYPGLSIHFDHDKEWEHLCSIEDLCFMTIRSDATVEISRKNGIPVYVTFLTVPDMLSFVSVCDGYYRLMIKWTFNICKDITSPSLVRLHKFKCHGPVGGEFSYHKLEDRRKNKPGCFIMRQCEQKFGTYFIDVCTKKNPKPETYKVEEDSGYFTLCDKVRKKFSSLPELIAAHKKPDQRIFLEECLPPSEYDKSQLLLCQDWGLGAVSKIADVDLENLLSANKGPRCIHTKNLFVFRNTRIEDNEKASVLYKAEWHVSNDKKLTVAMKMLKADTSDKHMKEFIDRAGQWAFLQSTAIVRLFGVTLRSPVAMIMEYLPYGSLDRYLMDGHKMLVEDLVEAASSLATALYHLSENNVVHGNIRCRKLLVAAHHDSHFSIKLSDPGLHSSYGDREIHWIPVECFHNYELARLSPLADVWAFATTLWEIFSYSDYANKINEINRIFTKKIYLSGNRLNKPVLCPNEVYHVMSSCWNVDYHQRAKPHAIMRDINQVLYQTYNSRRQHSYATITPKLFNQNHKVTGSTFSLSSNMTGETCIDSNLQSAIDLDQDDSNRSIFSTLSDGQTTIMEDLDSEELDVTLSCNLTAMMQNLQMNVDSVDTMQSIFELGADCNVILQGRIGQGFYGEVFRGMLERNNDSEPQQVAVKKLKTLEQHQDETLHKDFRREMTIMQNLNHPNIVRILGMVEEPELQLVMEFVQHGSLQSYLKIHKETKSITKLQLLNYALDVARGMEYLGTQKLVHRDLAARNILVASENHVKISDFGLAQFVNKEDYYISQTERDVPIKWYAPESVAEGKFSSKSDVWSYGVTLWEMFSFGEQPPSWGPSQETKSAKLCCPESCPAEVYSRFMLVCWQIVPVHRPTFTQLIAICQDLISQYL